MRTLVKKMSKQPEYEAWWSPVPTTQQLALLDNPLLHGTPVQDFLSGVSTGGWQSQPYDAPCCAEPDVVNAFCREHLWQEVYEVCGVPDGYVEVASCQVSGDPAAVPLVDQQQDGLTPDLVRVKLQPCTEYLTPEQAAALSSLLCEYPDVFSVDGEIGMFPPELVPPLTIPTDPTVRPSKQKPYKLSKFEEDWLYGEVRKLYGMGLVEACLQAEWVSPIVLVKQGDKLRLCVNYQRLNAATHLDAHPMPRADDIVAGMAGCRYHSHLDVKRGFWHLPIAAADRSKTAFATPWGEVLQFTRCPFGLVNAPAAYQRAMDAAFAGISESRVYMDDNFVSSKLWEQHLLSLRAVFAQCRVYGIKLNWDKCSFAAPQVKCLGFIVGEFGAKVDPVKVEAITKLPPPKDVTGVKSFLGMAGFFREFVEHYAHLSAPLVYLTRKGVPFRWDAACQEAFDSIKQALVSAPCLRLPDWDRQFILHVDWSCVAVGSYLSQVCEDGKEHPIAFASRLLTPAESKYASVEGECLALVWATAKFRYYLYGRKFLVYTDHKNLVWLREKAFNNAKVQRWALRLQEFNFELQHLSGEENVVADCLSRACAAQLPLVVENGSSHQGGLTGDTSSNTLLVGAVWPQSATKQADLDAVECTLCGHPQGADNMAICDGCGRCYHLRCMVPPMTTVPSGSWYCPGCDPVARNGLQELYNPATPLRYHSGDLYAWPELLAYLRTGTLLSCPASADPVLFAKRMAAVQSAASAIRPHATLSGWFMVRRQGTQHAVGWVCCPPLEYRWDVMRLYHDALGHCGPRQLLAVLRKYYTWKGMQLDAEGFCKCCDACQRHRLSLPVLPDMQEPELYAGPFRKVHIDLCGPFGRMEPRQGRAEQQGPQPPGKAYIVLALDYFTKAAEFMVVDRKEAGDVARAVYDGWFCRYGVPESVTSDNGGEFEAEFRHMLSRLQVQHVFISPGHPGSNGAVERLVRTLKTMLVRMVNDHPEHWELMLPQARMAYTARVHSTTGVAPFTLLHGVEPRLAPAVQVPGAVPPLPAVPHDPLQYVQHLQEVFAELDQRAEAGIKARFAANQQAWQRRRSDFTRKGEHAVDVGDYVLVVRDNKSALSQPVQGPYKVVGFVRDGTSAVLEGGCTELNPVKQVFHRHVQHLAKYYTVSQVFGQCQ